MKQILPSEGLSGFIFDIVEPPISRKDERDLPSNMLSAHSTSASIMNLDEKELEQIFWEARSHDGCYTAITLFQHCFLPIKSCG